MCLIVQVFSFFIVNITKLGHDFYNFLISWHTCWQFLRMQNKVHDKCAHLRVMPDDCWGMMVCSSAFQGTQSASLDIWTPLDNFFWSKWLALSLSHSLKLSLSLSHSLAPGSLFKNWHPSACSQKHLSGLPFQNSKAAPSSLRSSVEVVVVVGPPYVMSFMSTRRCKACEETAGFYARRAEKYFPKPTLCKTRHLTTWSLKRLHQNAIQRKTFTMNCRGQSKGHPIYRGKLLSAHYGGAGRRCYGATCLTWNRSISGGSSINSKSSKLCGILPSRVGWQPWFERLKEASKYS